MSSQRDYDKELKDTTGHKYAYNFDFDVMHPFMLKSFIPFFKEGNFLELGSFIQGWKKILITFFQMEADIFLCCCFYPVCNFISFHCFEQ